MTFLDKIPAVKIANAMKNSGFLAIKKAAKGSLDFTFLKFNLLLEIYRLYQILGLYRRQAPLPARHCPFPRK